MKILRALILILFAACAMVLTAGAANAAPGHDSTCSGGTVASGTYHNLIISGICTIPDHATVTVNGNLALTRASTLNAMTASTVTIRGNVLVAPEATLSLGCSFALTQPPFPGGPVFCPVGVSHDVVWGSILANRPHTLKIDGITIHRNLVSVGGGTAVTGPTASTCEEHPAPLNFPVKDNTINGDVLISGWQGCWLGYIRNVQGGSAIIAGNRTADADSTEIVTNTITGSLICLANSPAPQIGDSMGLANTVSGHKIGQCARL